MMGPVDTGPQTVSDRYGRAPSSSGPESSVILALDQGTTNTKAVLVAAGTGEPLASASRPVGIRFPQPGWVEQDADQLWTATVEAARECLEQRPDRSVDGIAISSQRESVVCWNRRTGEPLGPVLGWQDTRTSAACARLAQRRPDAADLVSRRTGLSLDPMFSAPKMRAAMDAALQAGVAPADVALGTIDSWLIWRLTGEHLTEVGNASRTLLLDLRTLGWHPDLLDLFGIPEATLPHVRSSDAGFGSTIEDGDLPAGIPVLAVLADSHAALYHQGCLLPGTGKATYGTGSSVMSLVKEPEVAPPGIATTVAWRTAQGVSYAREGNIAASGSALDWMALILGESAETSRGALISELAAEVADTGAVSFVPAFTGLGAPYWDRNASGLLTGLTAGTTRAHLARAALEAVAHQVADVVDAMESDGALRIGVLKADGGATASELLMQLQADLLQRPVEVANAPEASALGAALLAARTLGLDTAATKPGRLVKPRSVDAEPLRRQWARAVARSRSLTGGPT